MTNFRIQHLKCWKDLPDCNGDQISGGYFETIGWRGVLLDQTHQYLWLRLSRFWSTLFFTNIAQWAHKRANMFSILDHLDHELP